MIENDVGDDKTRLETMSVTNRAGIDEYLQTYYEDIEAVPIFEKRISP